MVSAVGAAAPVHSVVNVDQSLRLAGFKAQLDPVAPMLRDPAAFPAVIQQLFEAMRGMLPDDEFGRISAARRPDQEVVLGVWELILSSSEAEIDAVVEAALAGYTGQVTPYLSLFGIDPGEGYDEWLGRFIDGAALEVWTDHGHYPHLVDPDRFAARLRSFWGD